VKFEVDRFGHLVECLKRYAEESERRRALERFLSAVRNANAMAVEAKRNDPTMVSLPAHSAAAARPSDVGIV
jgi:hypothetical protein